MNVTIIVWMSGSDLVESQDYIQAGVHKIIYPQTNVYCMHLCKTSKVVNGVKTIYGRQCNENCDLSNNITI